MKNYEDQYQTFLRMSEEVEQVDSVYYRVAIKWLADRFCEPFSDDETIRPIATYEDIRIFRELDDAQKYINNVESRQDATLYTVRIDEMTDGSSLFRNRPIQSWLYDGTGALVDHIINENYGFFGQREDKRRFRVGDIVVTLWHDYMMRIGIVVAEPMTPEDAWKDAVTIARMTNSDIVNGLHPDHNGYEICYADGESENLVIEHPFKLMHYTNTTAQQKDKLLKHLGTYTRIRNAMKTKSEIN